VFNRGETLTGDKGIAKFSNDNGSDAMQVATLCLCIASMPYQGVNLISPKLKRRKQICILHDRSFYQGTIV